MEIAHEAVLAIFDMHQSNYEMWRIVLGWALADPGGRSICGYDCTTPGRGAACYWTAAFSDISKYYDVSENPTDPRPNQFFMDSMMVTRLIEDIRRHDKEPAYMFKLVLQNIARKSVSAMTNEEARVELEAMLVSEGAELPKIILVVHQLHLLALAGDACAAVVQQLFHWAHAPNSIFIFVGLTSREHLPQGLQDMVQHSLSPVTMTDELALKCERGICTAAGSLLHSNVVKQWINPITGCGDLQETFSMFYACIQKSEQEGDSHIDAACTTADRLVHSFHVLFPNQNWAILNTSCDQLT
jgi:hypothetical protein